MSAPRDYQSRAESPILRLRFARHAAVAGKCPRLNGSDCQLPFDSKLNRESQPSPQQSGLICGDSHYWAERKLIAVLSRRSAFPFLNAQKIDQAVQVAAGHTQISGAFRLAPTGLAQGANDEASLEAAYLILVRATQRRRFAAFGRCRDHTSLTQRRRQLRDVHGLPFG